MSFEAMSESLITDESAATVESEAHRPVTTSNPPPYISVVTTQLVDS